jgi:hypothetical protein
MNTDKAITNHTNQLLALRSPIRKSLSTPTITPTQRNPPTTRLTPSSHSACTVHTEKKP